MLRTDLGVLSAINFKAQLGRAETGVVNEGHEVIQEGTGAKASQSVF